MGVKVSNAIRRKGNERDGQRWERLLMTKRGGQKRANIEAAIGQRLVRCLQTEVRELSGRVPSGRGWGGQAFVRARFKVSRRRERRRKENNENR